MKAMNVLRRVTGMGIVGSLALALLTGGCALAAIAGPRQSAATGTRVLQQTIDGAGPLAKTVVVSGSWATVNDDFAAASGNTANQILAPSDLDNATTQFRREFNSGALRLASQTADWVGMTSVPGSLRGAPPTLGGLPASWRSRTGTRSPGTCGCWPGACHRLLRRRRRPACRWLTSSGSWSPRRRRRGSGCGPALRQ